MIFDNLLFHPEDEVIELKRLRTASTSMTWLSTYA